MKNQISVVKICALFVSTEAQFPNPTAALYFIREDDQVACSSKLIIYCSAVDYSRPGVISSGNAWGRRSHCQNIALWTALRTTFWPKKCTRLQDFAYTGWHKKVSHYQMIKKSY